MPNGECNLECLNKNSKDEVLEFVGPVKIVLVDRSNSSDNLSLVCYSAMITTAELLLAVVTTLSQFYSMSYTKKDVMKGLHVLFGIFGLQACLLSGLVTLNSKSGSAAPMRTVDRIFEHKLVEFYATVCSACSLGFAYYAYGHDSFVTIHSIAGVVANCVILLGGATGLFLCGGKPKSMQKGTIGFCTIVHIVLGILASVISATCFVTGITRDAVRNWFPEAIMCHFMIGGCGIYTMIILYKPLVIFFTGTRDDFAD